MKNYSQNNEQEIILNHFSPRSTPGRFLDIGAYNGTDLSNTRALLELGWTGVLVEPNPYNLVPLMESVRGFEGAVVVSAAIGDTIPPLQRLRLDETPGRGWAASLVRENSGVMQESPLKLYVPVLEVSELRGFGPFDFISIDAEWADRAILEQFKTSDLILCRMLIIEPGGVDERESMKATLRKLGFNPDLHATPENIIGVK